MQISIAFDSGEGFSVIGKKLEVLSQEFKGLAGATAKAGNVDEDAPPPKRRGRPPGGGKAAAEPPEGDEDDVMADGSAEGDEPSDDDLGFDEDPPPKKKKAPVLVLDDVRKAFKAFSGDKGKDKALAVMKRLGVTKLDQLKPDQYALAMKSVGA